MGQIVESPLHSPTAPGSGVYEFSKDLFRCPNNLNTSVFKCIYHLITQVFAFYSVLRHRKAERFPKSAKEQI